MGERADAGKLPRFHGLTWVTYSTMPPGISTPHPSFEAKQILTFTSNYTTHKLVNPSRLKWGGGIYSMYVLYARPNADRGALMRGPRRTNAGPRRTH
jgi:hypothetical protein